MTRQLFQYDPTIGYHFVPNLKARVEHEAGGYLLRTNRDGFRCRHPFEKQRKADGSHAWDFLHYAVGGLIGAALAHRFGERHEADPSAV